MAESANGMVSGPDYTVIYDRRRHRILSVGLTIIVCGLAVFTAINFLRGYYLMSAVEALALVGCIFLKYRIRSYNHIDSVSRIVVIVLCAVGLLAFWLPNSHLTVFVWPLMVPLFAFFLLSKRLAIIISTLFLGTALALFLNKYAFGSNALPLVALCNITICMVAGTVIAAFYENTRLETEQALIKYIKAQKRTEKEKEELIGKLTDALAEVKALSGLLPICANCKKIRDDTGYWNQIEEYISDRSEADFTHSICPECVEKLYPEISRKPRAGHDEDAHKL